MQNLIRKTWRRSIEIMTYAFDLTGQDTFGNDEILKGKIRKQALFISVSISHGHRKRHTRESVQFFRSAQIGAEAIQNLFHSSHLSGYITKQDLIDASSMYHGIIHDTEKIIKGALKTT